MFSDTIRVESTLSTELEVIEKNLDRAWHLRTKTNKIISHLLASRIAHIVREHIPNAHVIVLREDTSHLPAHGHVDDILNKEGESLMPEPDNWHDLYWTAEVDDDVYDLYDIVSYQFIAGPDDSNIRKLRILL